MNRVVQLSFLSTVIRFQHFIVRTSQVSLVIKSPLRLARMQRSLGDNLIVFLFFTSLHCSFPRAINSGVPHGSVPSLTLFLFINDFSQLWKIPPLFIFPPYYDLSFFKRNVCRPLERNRIRF